MTDKQLTDVLRRFTGRFSEIEREYLVTIGKHIKAIGTLLPSDVSGIVELKRLGRNLNRIKQLISSACGITIAELDEILTEVGKTDYRIQEERLTGVHRKTNIITPKMRSIIAAQFAVTAGAMTNLSNTTILSHAYRRAVDKAVMAIQSGTTDYVQATRHAILQAAKDGLRVQYPSGLTRRLDTAVRQNVLDATRDLGRAAIEEAGKDYGADGVQISAHMLCAPDHLPYQGRMYSNAEFERINESLDRPFGMWNCRHIWYPVIMAIARQTYSEETLMQYARNSTERIKIGDKTLSRYAWTQEQRAVETRIRDAENVRIMAQAAEDAELEQRTNAEIRALRTYYNSISQSAGLIVKNERTLPTIR